VSRLEPYSSLVPSLPSPVVSIAVLVLVGSGVGRVQVTQVVTMVVVGAVVVVAVVVVWVVCHHVTVTVMVM
jgi:hypothetical protein